MTSDARELIAEINRRVADDEFNLSEWEADFIESVGQQLEDGRDLTDKQDAVLERIWRRATS